MFIFRENWDRDEFFREKRFVFEAEDGMDDNADATVEGEDESTEEGSEELPESQAKFNKIFGSFSEFLKNLSTDGEEEESNAEASFATTQMQVYLADNFTNFFTDNEVSLLKESNDPKFDGTYESVLISLQANDDVAKLLGRKKKWKNKPDKLMPEVRKLIIDPLIFKIRRKKSLIEADADRAEKAKDINQRKIKIEDDIETLYGRDDLPESAKKRLAQSRLQLDRFEPDPDLPEDTDKFLQSLKDDIAYAMSEYKDAVISKLKEADPEADVSKIEDAETVDNLIAELGVSEGVSSYDPESQDYKRFLAKYTDQKDLDGLSLDVLQERFDDEKKKLCDNLRRRINALKETKASAGQKESYIEEIDAMQTEASPEDFESSLEMFSSRLDEVETGTRAASGKLVDDLQSGVIDVPFGLKQIADGGFASKILEKIFEFLSKIDTFGLNSMIAGMGSKEAWSKAGFEKYTALTGKSQGKTIVNHMGKDELDAYIYGPRDIAEDYLLDIKAKGMSFGADNVVMDSMLASSFTVQDLMDMSPDGETIDEESLPTFAKKSAEAVEAVFSKVEAENPEEDELTMSLSQFIADNLAEADLEEEPE